MFGALKLVYMVQFVCGCVVLHESSNVDVNCSVPYEKKCPNLFVTC